MRNSNPQRSTGLTLLKFLFVIGLIGVIVTIAASFLSRSLHEDNSPQGQAAAQQVQQIAQALDKYHDANGVYPTTAQGLVALIVKPAQPPVPENWQVGGYINQLPRDPWGNSYQYRMLNDDKVQVYSYGAKGPSSTDEKYWISQTISK